MSEEKMTPEEIQLARALRLAVISQQHRAGNLTEAQARELLRGPLTPGDDSTIVDDSSQLMTDDSIARTARAEGFRAGAEAMRAMCEKWLSEEVGLMEEEIAELRALPLPEPQP